MDIQQTRPTSVGRSLNMEPHSLISLVSTLNEIDSKNIDSVNIKEVRALAVKKLETSKSITPKNEDFKYTNLQAALKPLRKPEVVKGIDSVHGISSYDLKCVLINGKYSVELSNLKHDDIKVYESSQELPKEVFSEEKTNESNESPLKILSDATFSQVTCINVKDDSSLALEVISLNISKNESEDESTINFVSPRLNIKVGKNADFKIVEYVYSVTETPFFTNHLIDFNLEEGASVEHVRVQCDNEQSIQASTIVSHQIGKSVFKTVSLNFGSKLTRNEVYPSIHSSNSETWLIGANILSGSQAVDNFTVIEHVADNCESHELYKGMYGGKSKGVFSGTIIVRESAQKTNAYQSNASLLCSDDSESYSRPQLKIWADDVKCSHGATVGQLDDEALFYLRSRGIPENQAKVILTRAYVSEVFTHISDDTVKLNVEKLLEDKLNTLL